MPGLEPVPAVVEVGSSAGAAVVVEIKVECMYILSLVVVVLLCFVERLVHPKSFAVPGWDCSAPWERSMAGLLVGVEGHRPILSLLLLALVRTSLQGRQRAQLWVSCIVADGRLLLCMSRSYTRPLAHPVWACVCRKSSSSGDFPQQSASSSQSLVRDLGSACGTPDLLAAALMDHQRVL